MQLLAIAPPTFGALPLLRARAGDGISLTVSDVPDVVREAIRDAEVVVVHPRAGALLREVWDGAARVRWVHALAAGVDTLLFEELVRSEVVVTNGRGVFADALGEFAAAAMLHFAKDVPRLLRNQRGARWEPFTVARLEGQTVGVVGLGSIGRAVARLATAFGMRVIATRRDRSAGGPLVSLAELLESADYVVVSTPLTAETRGMIGSAELARMKPSAVLINIGRGAVVDQAALVEALRERQIRGAALDVFEVEPLPPDDPLWMLDNVLVSPHCADHTADSHDRAMEAFLRNLDRFRRGEPLENVVDKRARY